MTNLKAIAYYRVSSESQRDNTSLENQKNAIAGYALANNVDIVAEFRDVASGGTTNRKGFQMAMEFINTHAREVQVFIVFKYDRAHRNLKETLIFVDELDKKGIAYVSVSQKIDTTTPAGRLFFQMICSFAEFEKEVIRERCLDGRKGKIRKNEAPGGRPPLGYSETWAIETLQAEIARDLFSAYLQVGSLAKLAAYAKSKQYDVTSGLCLSRRSLRDILRNRAYLGEFRYNGKREKHQVVWKQHHAAVIPPELFENVQHLMDRKRKRH